MFEEASDQRRESMPDAKEEVAFESPLSHRPDGHAVRVDGSYDNGRLSRTHHEQQCFRRCERLERLERVAGAAAIVGEVDGRRYLDEGGLSRQPPRSLWQLTL